MLYEVIAVCLGYQDADSLDGMTISSRDQRETCHRNQRGSLAHSEAERDARQDRESPLIKGLS